MCMKLHLIGISGKKNSPKAIEAGKKTIEMLKKRKINFVVNKKFLPEIGTVKLQEMHVDAIICFGGDGTLLATLHKAHKSIPVLGVFCGKKGALLEETPASFFKKIDSFIKGEFEIKEWTRLRALADGIILPLALNDVTLVPKEAGRLIRYRIDINDEFIGTQGSDGFIVATPTGSTGHNVSAGGAIIKWHPHVLSFVEINSIDLTNKSIIIPDNSIIRAYNFERGGGVETVIDGQKRFQLKKELVIKKGHPAKVIKLK
ncbi:MAG: NAD(+)/NADH kinase [Candidatus Diapherotrites archaeon]|nr:NAD(+)/NADH kinase [Candidatus Diapherotrites archaeon]